MHRSTAKLASLLLAAVAASCGFFVVAHAICWPHERDALLAFKQGIINDTYNFLDSWQQGRHDCCRWAGVACSNETGHVIELDLASSYLVGQMSLSLFSLQHLEYLNLNTTYLLGPNGQNCSSLVFLDLGMNKFYGMLPTWIGELVNLQFLELNHNMFYGDIPFNITNLILLQHFSLANNNISGSIPSSLSKLAAMTLKYPRSLGAYWYLNMNKDDVLSVVMKQQELKYRMFALRDMVGIDLSLNHLTGRIPDEITSLKGLLNLNLSWNHLTGKIPAKIGALKSLESLDLSRNSISGEIPPSLSDLTYLSSLDLSYNNLAGTIPTGRQLDTLYTENPSMYSGNIGLCGPPLEKSCPGNDAPEHRNQQQGSENGYDTVLFFYFGLAAGFVAGLWVVFCALLFNRAWRNAYFRLFDKLYDNVYVFAVVTWESITSNTTAS
ncbi:hypothetical protein ACQ4PT_063904 [Festuca glaucescens]